MNETTRIPSADLRRVRLHGATFMAIFKDAITTPELDAEAALALFDQWIWALKLDTYGEGDNFASISNIAKGFEIAREIKRIYQYKFLLASAYLAMMEGSTLPETNRNLKVISERCWSKFSQDLLVSVAENTHIDALVGVYLHREAFSTN